MEFDLQIFADEPEEELEIDDDDDDLDFTDVEGESDEDDSEDTVETKLQTAIVDKAKAEERARILSEQLATQQKPTTQPQQQQISSTPPRRKLREVITDKFADEFVANPREAFAKILDEVDQEVDRRTSAATYTQGASVVDSRIASFVAEKREEDPEEYALAIKAFNERKKNWSEGLKAQYANAPSHVLFSALNTEWDASVAAGVRENRKKVVPRSADPPIMRGRGAVGTSTTSNSVGKLTPTEKTIYGQVYDAMDHIKDEKKRTQIARNAVKEFRRDGGVVTSRGRGA